MVYLLHFKQPYKHARHYIGFVTSKHNLSLRLDHHKNGSGARLMQVLAEAGIEFELAATWEGDRNLERKLKNRHGASRFCPICQKEKHHG